LFDLNASARLITCRLVEVKCYANVGDVGAYNELKNDIVEQLAQSEEVISLHFDPHRSAVDRLDRLLKTRQLVNLLEFYLDRAERYRIIDRQAAEEARFFLRTLESGYRLTFTRSALIFDFQRPGTEGPDCEAGVEFHRIGIDLIRHLIESAAPDSTTSSGIAAGGSSDGPPPDLGPEQSGQRQDLVPPARHVDGAAFQSENRNRSVSWESLRSRRALGGGDDVGEEIQVVAKAAPRSENSDPPAKVADCHQPESAAVTDASVQRPESNAESSRQASDDPQFDVMLGVTGSSPQYGLLGDMMGRRIALDLNQTHTISLFGVQGGGKSYTLGSIVEMASLRIPHLNRLPQPLAVVIFHYSPTMDYRPEFTSMVHANSDEKAIEVLRQAYHCAPAALKDVVLLVPPDKLDQRKSEYPGLEIHGLKFASSELQTSHWRFLMGAVGNQATYIRQLNRVMKSLRNDLSVDGLRHGIDNASLPDHLKELARMRLDMAAEYIDDSKQLRSLIAPGRLIIVDLRDEFIEKDEALGLFVVLMQIFADAKHNGEAFNKLVVFDEAHKYVENEDLVAGLIEVVREMRHKGTSIMVASQDPPSVPVPLIELSSQIILHKFNSPSWLKHIQKANAALAGLTPEKMSHLKPGEAYVWSSKASDESFSKGAIKIHFRPRVTLHGGSTKTAVGE